MRNRVIDNSAQNNLVVHNTGNETIAGNKKFTGNTTLSGLTAGSTTMSGLSVTGNTTLSGLTAGSTTISGLSVTGNTTLSGLTAGSTTISGLNVTGNTTLYGLTLNGDIIRKISIDVSQIPTTNTYILPYTVDNADQSVRAFQQVSYRTNGVLQNSLGLRRTVNGTNIFNAIDLEIDVNGNKSVNVVTPPTTSNSANIATTAFVKSVLSSSGNGLSTFSQGQNGYYKFTNGLIIQWGTSQASGSKMTVTLPTAFTSGTSYQVITQFTTQSANCTYIENQTSTSFGWDRYSGIGNNGILWVAIGY